MSDAGEGGACTCERLRDGRYHDRDCARRLQAFINGNAVDGYEVGVVNEGTIMQGSVERRHVGRVKSARKARRIAAKMLADERRREQSETRERVL